MFDLDPLAGPYWGPVFFDLLWPMGFTVGSFGSNLILLAELVGTNSPPGGREEKNMSQAQTNRIALISRVAQILNYKAARAQEVTAASEEAAQSVDQVDPRLPVAVGDFAALGELS